MLSPTVTWFPAASMRAGIRFTAGSAASDAMRANERRTASSSRACLTAARRVSWSASTTGSMESVDGAVPSSSTYALTPTSYHSPRATFDWKA